MDIACTCDVRMHRVGICRASGRRAALAAAHDGRLFVDMAAGRAGSCRQALS